MIKFSQKVIEKPEILNLIDAELLNIEVALTFQENLNGQILSYLKTFMNENPFTNDSSNMNNMSDYLGNISKYLKKSSTNLSKYRALQNKLKSTRKSINSQKKIQYVAIKALIDEYNKKYDEVIEKTDPITAELQLFLSKCYQDEILKDIIAKRNSEKQIENKTNSENIIKQEEIDEQIEDDDIQEEIDETNDEEAVENETITETLQEEESNSSLFDKIDNLDNDDDIVITPEKMKTINSIKKPKKMEKVKSEQEENNIKKIDDSKEKIKSNVEQSEKVIKSDIKNIEKSKNILKTDIENTKKSAKPTSTSEVSEKENNSEFVENTLIISEKNDNVILPYKISDLEKKLKKHPSEYENLQDVIDKEYTKPLKYYKNSSIARFKETYKLVKKRSNGSLKHALDMAFEALFNSDLHPAIISACKTVDELDIYLSCLEYDELEDFKFFKIIFDIVPSIIKKKNSLA